MARERNKPRWYWDSNCFLGFLLEEPGRVETLGEILRLARRGKIEILTSAFTLTEVLALRKKSKMLEDEKGLVRSFFKNSFIKVIPLLRPQAELARDLAWKLEIEPNDCIHLAAAIAARANLFNTYDQELLSEKEVVAKNHRLVIKEPEILQGELDL